MKRINLDQMKNMSIDNLIELYRDGYRLEEHTPITPLSDVNISNFPNILSNIHTLQGPLLDPVINFGKVTVSTGYDAATTSIILNTNEGSKLPDPSSGAFNLVWWNSTDYPDPSDDPNKEIVRCTAKTTDTLTVTRAQEGTTATTKNTVGKTYKIILTPTAKMMSDISSAITTRVAKSGDTMTGTLNLPSNGLIVGTNQLIVSGGNVGIGTTNPQGKLHINVGLDQNFVFRSIGSIARLEATNDAFSSDVPIEFSATQFNFVNGNVGIGTTNPVQPLHVRTGTDQNLHIRGPVSLAGAVGITAANDANSLNTPLEFRSSVTAFTAGNVGIGTTSPGAPLEVSRGSSSANTLYLRDTGAGIPGLRLYSTGNANPWALYAYDNSYFAIGVIGSSEPFAIKRTGEIGIGMTSPGTLLDVNGKITALGGNTPTTGGFAMRNVAGTITPRITSDAEDATVIRPGASGAKVKINNFTNSSELVHFLDNGNVGIGTESPPSLLTIQNGNILIRSAVTTGSVGNYNFGLSSVATGGAAVSIGIYRDNANEAASLTFNNWNGASTVETMRITSAGNVGIGTTSPSAKLDVGGTDAIKVPNGTTAQRPASPVAGMIRFNITTLNFEGYTGSDWRPIVSLFAISASDNIIHAHDAAASTTSVNVIVKMKTITMGYSASGSVRIKFSLWSSSPSNTGAAGRIYKNGLPIGTLRYAQTILTFSEDFNMTWLSGDTIELWGNPYTNALAIYVSDFRICAVASGGTATNS